MTNASELIFVGIDVSKATLEIALDDSAKTQTLGNNEAGIQALLARLEPLRDAVAVVLLGPLAAWSKLPQPRCAGAGLR